MGLEDTTGEPWVGFLKVRIRIRPHPTLLFGASAYAMSGVDGYPSDGASLIAVW